MIQRPSQEIFTQLIVLLLLVILFSALGQGISYLILKTGGVSFDQGVIGEIDSASKRQLTRLALAVGHMTSFLVSSFIFLYIYHNSNEWTFLKLNSVPGTTFLYLSFFLLVSSYPLVGKIGEFNASIPLPEWMQTSSESAMDLLQNILTMESGWELVMSFFLVAIVPAIGEEVLYRGIVQTKFQRLIGNNHLGIIVASLFFSLNHMQFDRFLPFALLGIILGYAYYYSRTLWVPVILHLINNGFQVLVLYNMEESVASMDLNDLPQIPTAILLISLLATIGIFVLLKMHSEKVYEQRTTA